METSRSMNLDLNSEAKNTGKNILENIGGV